MFLKQEKYKMEDDFKRKEKLKMKQRKCKSFNGCPCKKFYFCILLCFRIFFLREKNLAFFAAGEGSNPPPP